MHVHWQEGLFLQPHHLQTMQRGLQEEIRASRSLSNPYCFGVIEYNLSADHLADKRVRFEKLRAIMPSGQEVFFPEDATLPALDIRAEMTRSGGPLEIVLAVPLWSKSRANAFADGQSADPRVKLLYIPEEVREVADENTGENPQALRVRKVNARLSQRGDNLADMEFLPLLRVVRAVGEGAGQPRQDPEFVPPCLFLRSSPTLHDLARTLVAQLNASREQFRIKAFTGGLGLEAKWELTMKLTVLNRFCSSLPCIVEKGEISPFALYLELRELLGELLALHPVEKLFDCRDYDHWDPLPSFKELDQKIRPEILVTPGRQPFRVPFSGQAGLLRAALELKHFNEPNGYFLGINTRLDGTRLAEYVCDPNKFKLMPTSLEMAAIFGMELKKQDFPPLALPAEGGLHYFRVTPSSNENRWEQIRRDASISLVWNNNEFNLAEAAFALFMTLP